MGANQYTQRPLVTLRWHAGVQSHHQWGIYKKPHFRGLHNNTEQTTTSSLMSQHHPFTSPAPHHLHFWKHIFWWQKHLQRHTEVPLPGFVAESERALSPLLTGNCSFVFCIVQRREMRRLPSPFTAVQSTAVWARQAAPPACNATAALPLYARSPGGGYGREMRARSVEHLTNHPSSASPSSLTDDTMTAAPLSQCHLLYQNLDHRLCPVTASHASPYCPLIRLNQGFPTFKVCRNAQIFTLNALWNFKNVSYCSLNILNNNKSKAFVFVFIYLLFTLFGLMIATFHLNTFIALL